MLALRPSPQTPPPSASMHHHSTSDTPLPSSSNSPSRYSGITSPARSFSPSNTRMKRNFNSRVASASNSRPAASPVSNSPLQEVSAHTPDMQSREWGFRKPVPSLLAAPVFNNPTSKNNTQDNVASRNPLLPPPLPPKPTQLRVEGGSQSVAKASNPIKWTQSSPALLDVPNTPKSQKSISNSNLSSSSGLTGAVNHAGGSSATHHQLINSFQFPRPSPSSSPRPSTASGSDRIAFPDGSSASSHSSSIPKVSRPPPKQPHSPPVAFSQNARHRVNPSSPSKAQKRRSTSLGDFIGSIGGDILRSASDTLVLGKNGTSGSSPRSSYQHHTPRNVSAGVSPEFPVSSASQEGPLTDVLPPKGHLRTRIAAWTSGASPSAPSTSTPVTAAPSSFVRRRFDSNPLRNPTLSNASQTAPIQADSTSSSASPLPSFAPPPQHPSHSQSARPVPPPHPSTRPTGSTHQSKPSMSFGAAGLAASEVAMGIGRRVGRLWGVGSSSSASGSGSEASSPLGGFRPPWVHAQPTGSSTADSRSLVGAAGASDLGSFNPSNGPILPPPLRPARRTLGGLVFGRPLAEAVAATAIEGGGEKLWVDEGGRMRGDSCPALVVRCIQHLEMWGVEEEGLFRITGRSSHAARLRAEFDAGADYDLRQAHPGDLDPHSVSSIFKAYLREMPEPILTRALSRSFEATLTNGTGSSDSTGFGNAIPLRTVTAEMLAELAVLVSRLPAENRSLLRELCRLLQRTADCYKTTKMPLNNLVLVFCPSLSMNPTMLRLLVEVQEQIFVDAPTTGTGAKATPPATPPKTVGSRPDLGPRQLSAADMKLARLTQLDADLRAGAAVDFATSSALAAVPAPTSASPRIVTAVADKTFTNPRLNSPRPGTAGNMGGGGSSTPRPSHGRISSLPLTGLLTKRTNDQESDREETYVRPRTPAGSLRALGAAFLGGNESSPSRGRTHASPTLSPGTPGFSPSVSGAPLSPQLPRSPRTPLSLSSRISTSFPDLRSPQHQHQHQHTDARRDKAYRNYHKEKEYAKDDDDEISSRSLQVAPHISLSIPGSSFGVIFPSSPRSINGNFPLPNSHRASWSEPILPLPVEEESQSSVRGWAQADEREQSRSRTPIADLFRMDTSSKSLFAGPNHSSSSSTSLLASGSADVSETSSFSLMSAGASSTSHASHTSRFSKAPRISMREFNHLGGRENGGGGGGDGGGSKRTSKESGEAMGGGDDWANSVLRAARVATEEERPRVGQVKDVRRLFESSRS